MPIRANGSIQSANTPTKRNTLTVTDNTLYRCLVTAVHFVDSHNTTQDAPNPRVLYDVVILGGFKTGSILSNCRLSSELGGNNSYYERVLTPSTKDLTKTKLGDQDGDIVLVQGLNGDLRFPIILGLDNGLATGDAIGSKESDGIRSRRQFNGIFEEIDKDGNRVLVYKDGTIENGVFVPNSTEVYREDYSRTNKTITRTLGTGVTVTEDGTTGDITHKATNKVDLDAAMVDLGSNATDKVVLFTTLASNYNAHTHPATPSPTGPPVGPLLPNVGSQTVKVQP